MARWTPIVYRTCTRCNRYPCPIVKRRDEHLREGTTVPVVVRTGSGPHQRPGGTSEATRNVREPSSGSGRSNLVGVSRVLPLLLLGAAALLLVSVENRSR